jgi:hypothetical protein
MATRLQRIRIPRRTYASSQPEWNTDDETVHAVPTTWFVDTERMHAIQALATLTRSEVRGTKKQSLTFIEAAIARDYLVPGWDERVFSGLPKTPDTVTLPLIHTSAVVPLAQDPARMLAAESIARSIFPRRHMIWTAASYVHISSFIDATTRNRRAPRVMRTHVHGAVRWQRESVEMRGGHNLLCYWNAQSFWDRLRSLHPEWEPLLSLGVFPWMYTYYDGYKVALMCPETPKGIELRYCLSGLRNNAWVPV